MTGSQPKRSLARKIGRFLLITLLTLIALAGLLLFALSLPSVQQRLTREVEKRLQEKLLTRVEIGAIRIKPPFSIALRDFLMEDRQGDTLACIGELAIGMDMWKLLDKTIELSSIRLENASVRLLTRDSINNYDFIVTAIANPDTSTVKPVDTSPSAWKFRIDLATIDLKSVDFSLQDGDAGSSTMAHVGALEAKVGSADIQHLRFQFDDLFLQNSVIRMVQTKDTRKSGKPTPAFAIMVNKGRIEGSQLYFSTPQMLVDANLTQSQLRQLSFQSADNKVAMSLQQAQVENSTLTYRDPKNPATPGHFNASDLVLHNLNADVADFSLQNDTLALTAHALSGSDKSGVELYEMRGQLQVVPNAVAVRDAHVRANNTSLDGDALLFKNDSATFDRMQIDLREARGIVGDLLVILPPQQNQAMTRLADLPYTASGQIQGSLKNLLLTDVHATAGKGTVVIVNGSVQNLNNTDQLGFDLRLGQLSIVRPDLLRFMALGNTPTDSILQTPLPAWANLSGALHGNLKALTLNLEGQLGTLQTGPVAAPATQDAASFAFSGELTNANDPNRLGMNLTIQKLAAPQSFFAFLAPKGIVTSDLLSASGTLRGTLANLNTKLEINALRGGGTSRISLNGALQHLNQRDQLGLDMVFAGELTRAEILGYVPDSVVTKVVNLPATIQFDGKAKGNTHDLEGRLGLHLGALGVIQIQGVKKDSAYQAEIVAENLQVGRLAADTALRAVQTVGLLINVEGTGFDLWKTARLNATGQFDSLVYNNLILREIVFDARVDGRRFDAGIKSPDARAAVNLRVQGDFTTALPLLDANLTVNCMDLRELGWSYRPTTVCFHMTSHSEGLSIDTLLAKINFENIDLQYDTVHVRPGDLAMELRLDNRNNQLSITSDWLKGELKGYFSLADLPKTFSNLAEQYFIVDRTNYVQPMGTDSLSLHLDLLQPQLLTTGLIPGLIELGTFHIDGSLNARTNFFDLDARLTRLHYQSWEMDSLNIRGFAGDSAAMFVVRAPMVNHTGKFFAKNAGIDGRFVANRGNATLTAQDADGSDRFFAGVAADLLPNRGGVEAHLQEKLILDRQAWTVSPENRIAVTPKGVQVEHLDMRGSGDQSISISGATQTRKNGNTGLDFKVNITHLQYDNFAVFIDNTLRDLTGWAEADLSIDGTTKDLKVLGTLQLHETAFTPALTNVHYRLSETPLLFTAEGLSFDGLTLRDPYDKELKISGRLNTQNWKDITANLSLNADEFQVLNTTRQQNSTYFGHMFVSVDGRVRGPLTSPEVTASIRTAKKSQFTYIYDAETQTAQHEGVVVFVEPARRYVRPPVYDAPAAGAGFSLNASIEIDSNLIINTVVNPVTGDAFNGKADGRLQFNHQPNGNMTLTGRVDLIHGVYGYSYQSVVKRSFQVATGSYLIWTGDVNNPELNLIARYEFRASPFPLVVNQLASATPEETTQYRRTQTFFLQTAIAGTPRQPRVDFKFIYPSDLDKQGLTGSFGNQDAGLVSSAISNLNSDPNQLSRQVFGVLLLRSFINESVGLSTTVSGDPLRSGLTSFLTNQVNALAAQYLSFIDVSVEARDAATTDGSSKSESTTQYELRLQKSFFDDRLTFKISGGTSVDASGDASQSGLDNASVEYSVTRDGMLKLTVFSERGFELLNASSLNLRNSGAGVLVTKEFNGRKRQKKQH